MPELAKLLDRLPDSVMVVWGSNRAFGDYYKVLLVDYDINNHEILAIVYWKRKKEPRALINVELLDRAREIDADRACRLVETMAYKLEENMGINQEPEWAIRYAMRLGEKLISRFCR